MPASNRIRRGDVGRLAALALSALLLAIGCNEGVPPVGENAPAGATTQETPLVPANLEAFEAYMTSALMNLEPPTSLPFDDTMPPTPAGPISGADGGEGLRFSTTNLQTQLVDESDTVKFDGQYLYVSHPGKIGFAPPIVPDPLPPGATPATVRSGAPIFEYPEYEIVEPASVQVLRAKTDPPSTEERAVIELEGAQDIHGLVLLPAEEDLPPLLAVIGTRGGYASLALDFADPWSAGEGRLSLWIYDVSDPEAPALRHRLRLEGLPIAVRRLGERLVLVTRFSPYLRALAPYAYEPEMRRDMIEDVSLEELLPQAWLGDGDEGSLLVRPERCFVPEERADAGIGSFYRPTLVTITSIELRDPDDRTSVCAAGPVDRVYSSVDALYLAASSYMRSAETIVHKFRYVEQGAAFRGSGRVAGRPGGTQWSFGLGEHDGVFGIMTTVSEPTPTGRFEEHHRLTLLREAATNALRLEEVAHLPNGREPAPIGKPDEDLHAVRFLGPRVYAVTFRRIDPLYIIDFEDPENPFIAGELVVTGFSDYLQPIGDKLLLGVGKDTVPDVNNDWFQGVKIELFDVSNPSEPVSADSLVIGRRGSETAARWDHQAVSVLDMESGLHRVALPIAVSEEAPASGDPDDPRTVWGWSHTGLHLFEVLEDEREIVMRGVVVAAPDDDPDTLDNRGTYGDRSRLQGEAVHYLHDGQVLSAMWGEEAR